MRIISINVDPICAQSASIRLAGLANLADLVDLANFADLTDSADLADLAKSSWLPGCQDVLVGCKSSWLPSPPKLSWMPGCCADLDVFDNLIDFAD